MIGAYYNCVCKMRGKTKVIRAVIVDLQASLERKCSLTMERMTSKSFDHCLNLST